MRHSRTIFAACSVVTAAVCFKAAGFRINFTGSAPAGVWRVLSPNKLEKGDWVAVCPPPRPIVISLYKKGVLSPGQCSIKNQSVEPLLKQIVALEGDRVVIKPRAPLVINGVPIANSKPRPTLPSWPAGSFQVGKNEVWVVSSYNEKSFDSRYFGPVETSDILGQAFPILVSRRGSRN